MAAPSNLFPFPFVPENAKNDSIDIPFLTQTPIMFSTFPKPRLSSTRIVEVQLLLTRVLGTVYMGVSNCGMPC